MLSRPHGGQAVNRYRVDFGYGRYYFEPNETGDWVTYEDHETENERLRAFAETRSAETREIRVERHVLQNQNERLRAALQKIVAYDPGKFRPLEDEIAIWGIATEALAACSAVPQEAKHE